MSKNIKVNYLKLAFRNLGRHKVKTIVTCLAVAIGVMVYIFTDALMLGMNIESKRNFVNYETGSSKIYSKAYFEKKDIMPLYEGFYDYEPIIEKLDAEGFKAAPHAVFNGSLLSKENEMPFIFVGVDPEMEKNFFHYDEYLEGGEFFETISDNIILGTNGAQKLKVGVGDLVKLSVIVDIKDDFDEKRHIYQLMELTVSGILNTPNPKINGNYGLIPLDILQDEMGIMLDGLVTEICIRKKDAPLHKLPDKTETPEVITAAMGTDLPEDLVVVSWEEDAKMFLEIMESKTGFTSIILFLLIIIVIIGVANTMLMAVFERTKEMGMLRSMGMKDGSVIILFLIEAGMIGLIGSVIGVILGALINIPMINIGLDYTEMMESQADIGFRITGIIRSAWNYSSMVNAVILMTIVPAVTAIFPARRGIKKSIADAMRFE